MFFQVDDQFQVNHKAMVLANRALTGDLDGLAALGLWTLAGSRVQAQLTDGVVSLADIVRTMLNPQEGARLAGLLVEAGLWHAPGHDCPRCPQVAEGTWLFHDWWQFKYDTADQARLKRDKRKELSNKRIRNEVWRRDRIGPPAKGRSEEADCRYCGKRLRRATRKGEDAPQIDHVDPSLVIGVDNLVICCQECNTKKGERSLEDAGMSLRPAPSSSSREACGPGGSAAAAGGEPGAALRSASGVVSREEEPARPAGRVKVFGPPVPAPVPGEGVLRRSPASAVADPGTTSPGPGAGAVEEGRTSGPASPGSGSGVGSEARDSDPPPDPRRSVAPLDRCDDAEKPPPPIGGHDLTARSEEPDQRQNQNGPPVPARTRAGGVGWGGAGTGLGEARAGHGEVWPGTTTPAHRGRPRRRRRSRRQPAREPTVLVPAAQVTTRPSAVMTVEE